MAGASDTKFSETSVARPADLLTGVGAEAWQAYNAMETTKRRHFDLLGLLDEKKKNYNIDPTEHDRRLLENLLQDHDEQVRRFTQASMELKNVDAMGHTGLFTYIGSINTSMDRQAVTH